MTQSIPSRKTPPEEMQILAKIMAELNRRDDCRVWRNNTGKLRDVNGRRVTFGLGTGSADLVGFVILPSGMARFFSLEVKQRNVGPSEYQIAWGSFVNERGGYWKVVRSVAEALIAVEAAIRGERHSD